MRDGILQRNFVQLFGQGEKTMILAHGFGCDQTMWRYIVPAFTNEYRVVVFDFVGSGRSDWSAYSPERYRDLNGYAQDVLDICACLNIRDAVYVGHSAAAMIGMLASIRQPDYFEKLVLIGPSPRYIDERPDYIGGFDAADIEGLLQLMQDNHQGWAQYLAPLVMSNADRPELARELGESFCAMDPDIAQRFARAVFLADNRADLKHVARPALILQCAQDVIAPLEVGAYVHHRLPNSTLRFMEATGHCPHLSHPDETIGLIQDYLRHGA
ncbi:alpha/beta fold hydrolase [Paenibacillus methanolicus]|uniref:Sigma-B regulation protein RsbQ n=1 Tax=Paenibacillus methanolicus TaxID=582686 RepID=A0A5S5C144_9BACL|nr:alpha/beta hydrolase [Paenibacillus methanolicus]TYP72050.1 sigma-B regulation protein RsbQ [Paenibacillus methanolicus]